MPVIHCGKVGLGRARKWKWDNSGGLIRGRPTGGLSAAEERRFRSHWSFVFTISSNKNNYLAKAVFFQGKSYHCCLVNIAEHGTRQLRRSSCSHKLFPQVFNTGVRDAESGLQVCSAASAMTKAKTSPSPSRTSRLNLLSALATLPSGSAFFRRHFTG